MNTAAAPLGLVTAMLLGVLASPAARSETAFELTPFVSTVAGGEFEATDDGRSIDLESQSGYGVTFDIGAPGFDRQYQLYYSRQPTRLEAEPAIDVDVEYLHVGGTLGFRRERYEPYIVGTLGATRFSPGPAEYDDETKFSLALGGGLKIPVGEHFAIRFEGRAFLTFVDSDSEIFCVSVGGDATCLIRTSGNAVVQYQALAGVTFRF